MQKHYLVIVVMLAALSLAIQAQAFQCTVCHSKNPRMVAMHKANEGKNCFGCHRVGEKLMGKGQSKEMSSLLKRRVTEAECLPCHGQKE